MGAKWSTVSTATYADGSPSDDGSATSANRIKYATIKTDLTDPLDTAIDSIVSKLDQLFTETTTPISTSYTTVASDHARVLEVTAGTITLLAASSAGVGYRVGVHASGANITVSRSASDTINGATSVTVGADTTCWFVANAAGNGYVASSAIDDLAEAVMASRGSLVQTSTPTTTGSSATYTGIPSWVNRITMTIVGLSASAGSEIRCQIGDGAIVTTGYLGANGLLVDASSSSANTTTAGLGIYNGSGASVLHGVCVWQRHSGNTWVGWSVVSRSDAARVLSATSSITLSGTLDRVRLVTSGSETFDAGSVNVTWE